MRRPLTSPSPSTIETCKQNTSSVYLPIRMLIKINSPRCHLQREPAGAGAELEDRLIVGQRDARIGVEVLLEDDRGGPHPAAAVRCLGWEERMGGGSGKVGWEG